MSDNPEPAGLPGTHEPRSSSAFGPPTVSPSGRVPLRQNVPSSSQIPTQGSAWSPALMHAPPLPGEQLKTLLDSQREMIRRQEFSSCSLRQEMEAQRNMFEDERALWLSREADLQKRILEVEALLRRSCSASPANTALSEQSGGLWTPIRSGDGTRRSSLSAAPPYPRSNIAPSKANWGAFPGGAIVKSVTPGRLANVRESIQMVGKRPLRPADDTFTLPKDLDPNLKDAGHTPMARRSLNMTTGVDGTGADGDASSTPKAGDDPQEESWASARQPREHQDSYFGSYLASVDRRADESSQNAEPDTPEDPQLEGPLGLTNSPENERNRTFLGELDKKLSQVNLTEAAGNSQPPRTPPSPIPSFHEFVGTKQMRNADGTTSDVPESEPPLRMKQREGSTAEEGEPEQPLRIKRSQNFGSALGQGGEVDYGRGFSGRQR